MNTSINSYGQEQQGSAGDRANGRDKFDDLDTDNFGIGSRGAQVRSMGASLLHNLAGNSWEMNQVEEEVSAEQRGRIAVVGRDEQSLRMLVATMRQEPTQPATTAAIQNEGLFTLIDLGFGQNSHSKADADAEVEHESVDATSWESWLDEQPMSAEQLVTVASETDCILYVFSATARPSEEDGWQPEDARWIYRLRSLGTPVIGVGLGVEGFAVDGEYAKKLRTDLRQRLSLQLVFVTGHSIADDAPEDGAAFDSAYADHDRSDTNPDVLALVKTILSVRSRLAIPLAQDIPSCRQYIARKIARTGAWMTTLLGAEPIPLLDLPLHIATHWRVALQIASAYGRPGLDYRSREMIGTVLLNLSVRYAVQQLLKLIPLVGWAGSALLSGASTLMLGEALIRYYEQESLLDFHRRQQASRQSIDKATEHASKVVNKRTTALRRHARSLKGGVRTGIDAYRNGLSNADATNATGTNNTTNGTSTTDAASEIQVVKVNHADKGKAKVHRTTGSSNNAGDFTEPPFEPDVK